jgi:adenylylsulfate kinase
MEEHGSQEYRIRSLTKAVTYRIIIVILDFTAVYLLTGRYDVALGFMIVSNVYTSIAYYFHERLWSGIGWGRKAADG